MRCSCNVEVFLDVRIEGKHTPVSSLEPVHDLQQLEISGISESLLKDFTRRRSKVMYR